MNGNRLCFVCRRSYIQSQARPLPPILCFCLATYYKPHLYIPAPVRILPFPLGFRLTFRLLVSSYSLFVSDTFNLLLPDKKTAREPTQTIAYSSPSPAPPKSALTSGNAGYIRLVVDKENATSILSLSTLTCILMWLAPVVPEQIRDHQNHFHSFYGYLSSKWNVSQAKAHQFNYSI